ncbi:SDR family oxidoreductase [Streptomyces sp. B1866]|uniref:SDR family oxidoreductase n=1 Tax=Streptomyces sp. B1866 TaxID=3075431 RepID=UPI00289182B4|nr:SDR family oxidoreductase [Streptomyces sp. B1866]MDT3399527.1 SDR family oxidoreductase [Streptomyces sp. B1866]
MAGSRILVVGTGPMGVATARAAQDAGAEVFLSSRSQERLDKALARLPEVHGLIADPEDHQQADLLVRQAGPLDHIAALAGGAPSLARGIADTPVHVAQRSFARFWLSYNLLQASIGTVREGGSVTLLSGASASRPSGGRGFWGSLHGAIEALGRNAAYELAPLRVNTVSPGGINVVPMNWQLLPHAGMAEDVASMVLAVMANPAVTGTVIDVDGGEFLGTFE